MIKGIGIDICKISRMRLKNHPKILNGQELDIYYHIKRMERRREFLAGRFAAKEAIFKAFSQIGKKVLLGDIEIIKDDDGRPVVIRPVFDHLNIHLSIAHEKEYAIAQVIIEEKK